MTLNETMLFEHQKFSMLSSRSFRQPDVQVDSSLYNYLSYKENFAYLKQQHPLGNAGQNAKYIGLLQAVQKHATDLDSLAEQSITV